MESALSTGGQRQRLLTAMVAAVVVTSAIVLFAFFVTGGQPSGAVIAWLFISGMTAAVAAGIWSSNQEAYESGTAASLANRSLLLGALAVLTPLVAFLGAGPLFAGAVVLGLKAMEGDEKIKPLVGMGLGAVAWVGTVVVLFVIFGGAGHLVDDVLGDSFCAFCFTE